MKIFSKEIKTIVNRVYLIQKSRYVTDFFPYTNELYKKNFIKYPTQSQSGILHDYKFIGDERLATFEERIKEFSDPNEELTTDIGKSAFYSKLRELRKQANVKFSNGKNDKKLERNAKDLKIKVPVEEINKLANITSSYSNILKIANHYNINKDLFGQSYFRPTINLRADYLNKETNETTPVFYGNRIPAKDTKNTPNIIIEDVLDSIKQETIYHSLLFLNLDGNFQESNNEVLLWFLGNIKNCDAKSGEELVKYAQPFPMRGTGWHRCAYVLFEHQKPLNFNIASTSQQANDKISFKERNFKTHTFYSTHKNELTPVGLCFFQTEWDLSVRDFFHNQLNMKEPVYEYDFGPKFLPRFEKYPTGQPFNWYLQEYMDKKDVNERVIKEYLKHLSPFESYQEPAKYPILDVDIVKPKWYKYEKESYRKRTHEWSQTPYKYSHQTRKLKEALTHLPYQQKN